MTDDLTALARRCTEIRVIHRFPGDPTIRVMEEGGAFLQKKVPGDECFTILARGPWDATTMRGEGKTIEEAVRNIHD